MHFLSLLSNLATFPVILFRKTRSASFSCLTLLGPALHHAHSLPAHQPRRLSRHPLQENKVSLLLLLNPTWPCSPSCTFSPCSPTSPPFPSFSSGKQGQPPTLAYPYLTLLSIMLVLSLLTNLAAFPVILFRKTRSASFSCLTLLGPALHHAHSLADLLVVLFTYSCSMVQVWEWSVCSSHPLPHPG
jgi:hypothetical protein